MAVEFGETGNVRKRKGDRGSNQRKLLLKEKVEVRSVEDGFLGSWHTGEVIGCEDGMRVVRYEHLLVEDESEGLVETLDVSPVVDGIDNVSWNKCNYRGRIRPVPPPVSFGKWGLPYGLCVDVLYKEAWWEGVIFDQEDGSKKRRIFFPDLGDELNVNINNVRITLDWDEVSESWKRRGYWLFFELIEEHEQQCPLCVSVKQIWYDVQEKEGFEKIREWTCTDKTLWKELVLEAISDNFKFTVNEILRPVLCLDEALDVNLNSTSNVGDSRAIVPLEIALNSTCIQPTAEKSYLNDIVSVMEDERCKVNLSTDSTATGHEKSECPTPQGVPVLPLNQDGYSETCDFTRGDGFSTANYNGFDGSSKSSKRRKTGNWHPVGLDILPGAEFCPDVLTMYLNISGSIRSPTKSLTTPVRKHLSYLGWKIESMRDGRILRLRYVSPEGKCFPSLRQVCQHLVKPASSDERSKSLLIVHPRESSRDPDYSPQGLVSRHSNAIVVTPKYCPKAISDYYKLRSCQSKAKNVKGMREKARNHLLAVGWVFWYHDRGHRQELRYTSPKGRSYCSLWTACKAYVDDDGACESTASICRRTGSSNVSEDSDVSKDEETQTNLLAIKGGSASELSAVFPISSLLKSKRRRVSGSLIKVGNDRDGSHPPIVMRSRKRARELLKSSHSHQNPRTVLSWLIDNNVILPRAKVSYRRRKNGTSMGEGRITREGIKCSCCQKVFTISNFEVHVGSLCRRPAACIFLEDGRSLLDCQMQMLHDNKNKRFTRQQPDRMKHIWLQGENDYICSVCNYGGELILCDQCPSSFHKSCLGLEVVPDGEWFCPSCCCGICGQNKLKEDTGHLMDNTVLTCCQCELKYHVGCLTKSRALQLENYPKENWLCSKKCEKICLGLHELLGKPIPLGFDNLTWTLLKSDSRHNLDVPDIDVATENNSKLNVALSVMHECFEPVKEPYTKRDLVEDVIFSQGSKLKRLNFQGFYTVLLERNDELISVATVRVYGDKVAELPLIGTRFHYRRVGMCRILMNELEKKLMELGVQRLVLPAVPTVLNTWTTSFGFSKMTSSERLQYLGFTFLDFQDTVMCQKFLVKKSSAELSLSRGSQSKHGDKGKGSIPVPKTYQVQHIGESRTVDQKLADITVADDCSTCGEDPVPLLDVVNEPVHESKSWVTTEDAIYQKEDGNKCNAYLKYYERRRISANRS